jgi:hypothetical protein
MRMREDRKSNRPTAGTKGTLPSKKRSGKAVCGAQGGGRRGKLRGPDVRWAWGGRGLPCADEERARASAPPGEPAPGVAGWTQRAPLAGAGYQEVMAALATSGTGEAVGRNSRQPA